MTGPSAYGAIRRLALRGYEASIIRRAMILCCFVLPAFGANLLVYYVGAALLSPESFGVFYVANTLGNVLFSGSLILNTLLTRYLVRVAAPGGESAARAAWLGLQRALAGRGLLVAAAAFTILLLLGRAVGIRSSTILLLVVLDIYAAYIADLGRALLQSLRRTVLLGFYTLAWMLARLALCSAGIMLFHSAGGALAGSIASALVVIYGFHLWLARSTHGRSAAVAAPSLPRVTTVLPITLGYGVLIAISNLDVLVSYFLLGAGDLGIYSASSVFPKAILVVTVPVLQLLFALMTAEQAGLAFRRAAGKSAAIVSVLAVLGIGAIWLSAPWSCGGGGWGLSLCDGAALKLLLLSVLPLSLLRILVLLQFARGRDRRVLFLALPVALYLWVAWISPRSIMVVATQFTVFAAVACGAFLCLCLCVDLVESRMPGGARLALLTRRSSARPR